MQQTVTDYEALSNQEASACSDEEEEDDSSATGVDHVSMPAPPNTGTLESSLSDMRIFDQTPGHSNQWALEDGNLAMNIPNYFPIQANSNPALGATAGGAWAMQPPVEDPYVTIPSTTEFKAQMKEYFPGGTLVTEFEVSIYYRGRKIWKEFVKNTNGFRLSYNTESAFPYLQDVWLPNTASVPLSDQQQIKYTTQLLERVDQGLTLEVQNNLISAQRYGRCKVFWSIGQDPTSTEPQEISNRNFTVLYGLAEFNKELYDFVNSTGGSPQYSIWLCFGELWPDRNGKSWNKKMIMVRVTPVTFKLLHELALGIGASSLKSDEVNLQFSDHLSTTSFLSVLEEYMDLS